MPKFKDVPFKQTLEVTYSDGQIENCTASYFEITPRKHPVRSYIQLTLNFDI